MLTKLQRLGTAMARKKRYAAQGRRWRQRELTWRLSQPTSQLTRRQIETEMREAFRVGPGFGGYLLIFDMI